MIKFFYITNKPNVAQIAEEAGVDRIFVDMEFIGKESRQKGLDTVQNHHTVEDIQNIKQHLKNAELLVRVNPIHSATDQYMSSKDEINAVINSGADIIMLPFFKTTLEVQDFLHYVGGRCKTMLLIETKEAVEIIDDILSLDGIDEIYIGLNDLHLSYGMSFMFQLLADGTVDRLVNKFKKKGIPYGFGGVARLGGGLLPAEYIVAEHYRLGSTRAILARAFCNCNTISDDKELREVFFQGMKEMRDLEKSLESKTKNYFENNHQFICTAVNDIVQQLKTQQ